MAPIAGASKTDVLNMLRGSNPMMLTLGGPHPEAVVQEEPDGSWSIRRLEMNTVARDSAYKEAQATEPFFWMPESEWRFLEPGEVVVSGENAKELADKIETMAWEW